MYRFITFFCFLFILFFTIGENRCYPIEINYTITIRCYVKGSLIGDEICTEKNIAVGPNNPEPKTGGCYKFQKIVDESEASVYRSIGIAENDTYAGRELNLRDFDGNCRKVNLNIVAYVVPRGIETTYRNFRPALGYVRSFKFTRAWPFFEYALIQKGQSEEPHQEWVCLLYNYAVTLHNVCKLNGYDTCDQARAYYKILLDRYDTYQGSFERERITRQLIEDNIIDLDEFERIEAERARLRQNQ